MCGRYAMTLLPEELMGRFGLEADFSYTPRYNIAPSQENPVVAIMENKRVIKLMRWGLVPSWAKDEQMGNRMINARAETVSEKPSFKRSLKTKRCLIPASGYYEWKELPESRPTKKVKVPMYFRLKNDKPFAFAGLWDKWGRFDGKEVISYTIITTEPNSISEPIHNRMPVILREEDEALWLDHTITDTEKLLSMLKPYPSDEMEVYEVSKLVNSPRNDLPDCIKPAV